MAKLIIRLLGPFQVTLDGKMLTDFRSDKIRGLLVYLIIESQRPWTRSVLADLFWPGFPEDKAQSNLSTALWNLRSLLGDRNNSTKFIIVQKSTIQFNVKTNSWIDVKALSDLVEKTCSLSKSSASSLNIAELQESFSQFEGSFMEGFYIESPAFETWIGKTRQAIHQDYIKALRCLSKLHLETSELTVALEYTQKWMELEPWDEDAYRQGMIIFDTLGQRKKALDLFEKCRLRLAKDLGMEPQYETIQLYQQIHQGSEISHNQYEPHPIQLLEIKKVDPGPVPEHLSKALLESIEPRPFFNRKEDLTQLGGWLSDAFDSYGKACFILGEPGSGKTYLLTEFASQALKNNPDLILFWGQCLAYTGLGDPYFPFMTIIRMLAGNLEPIIPGQILSIEHLNRLWRFLPEMLKNLINLGPDLIRRFMNDFQQFSLAKKHPGVTSAYLDMIEEILKESPKKPGQLVDLNDQFTQVLRSLSESHTTLLVIDDLQWIDEGSANLLFHLGRQLVRSKILLIGAFRPSEITTYMEETHPISGILQELQALYGNNLINLAHSQGKIFIHELLASEPNAFTPNFHQMLFNQTSGHPLFSIELLRGMQLRNEIVKDKNGRWIESAHLDWDKCPARVEAVIARRFTMLSSECQSLMIPACVQGENFSVETVSQVLKIPKNKVFDLLSNEVCKQHRLILPHGVQHIGDKLITYFRFRHALFQIYLNSQLNEVDKIYQHGLVAEELENQYKNHLAEFPQMAHTIARHFELAQDPEKAVHYYQLAGDYAMRLTAHQEAVKHYYHCIALLKGLPPSSKRDLLELDIQLSLGPPLTALKGWGPPELEKAYDRAQILCEGLNDSSKLIPALWLLGTFRLGRSQHKEVDRLVSRMIRLSSQTKDPALIPMANLQVSPIYQGRLEEARIFLEKSAADVDTNLQIRLAQSYGMAPAVIAASFLYNCLWLLGFVEQADKVNQQAYQLAEKVNHPMTTCYVLGRTCWVAMLRNDLEQLRTESERLYNLAHKFGFRNFELAASFFKNWLNLLAVKRPINSIEALKKNIEAYYDTKTVLNRTVFLIFFAKACLIIGQRKRGLYAINESITLGEKTGELWFQAEAWRIKGETLLSKSDQKSEEKNRSEALNCFKHAYQIAQKQGAKIWELRTAMSMAKFYASKGQSEVGRNILQQTYDWFTEGFKTRELQQAKLLLESLS